MLRRWTWILPCWIWKWAFRRIGKTLLHTQSGSYDAMRIDEEFLLVRMPIAGEFQANQAVKRK